MAHATLILLPQSAWSSTTTALLGEKQKAAGYYAGGNKMQTVTWDFTNVNGVMIIEASLKADPINDRDWFEVFRVDTGGLSTQHSYRNVDGNFVWLRCRVNPFLQGVVQSVKVSY